MTILLRLSTLFLLALSALLGTVSARPQGNMVNAIYKRAASPTTTEELLTNAARMAAGLGPLAPRTLFNPTRVNVARSKPSAITLSGRIEVTQVSNGNFIGFVDKNYRPDGRLPVNTNANAKGDHLTVSFTQPLSISSLFNVFITSNGNPHHPDLGFAHASATLQNFNGVYTILTGTNPTTDGGAASQVGNGMSDTRPYSESPIWSYDASTGRLSNTWFNPTGSGAQAVAVNTYYSSTTGSIVQSRADLSGLGFVQVYLTLV